jgi:starch synthase (maltosyl-transferring)
MDGLHLGSFPMEGRRRAVIENLRPAVDGGLFAVKRIVGESVLVSADAFADGHDAVRCQLLLQTPGEVDWQRIEMRSLGNDAWEAEFPLPVVGRYEFTVEAWVDHFQSWLRDMRKRLEARQDVELQLQIGAILVAEALHRASGDDVHFLGAWHTTLIGENAVPKLAGSGFDDLAELMAKYPDLKFATRHQPVHAIVADRERARFSSWYELFPRSTSPEPGRHGTFRDVIARLPYVARLGFDVLYLPPIHPIGAAFRKGKNNSVTAQPGEPGSPWAIGSKEGGHTAIHSELGTSEDFRALVEAARGHGIDIALDIAFQCSPDHPYAQAHQNWFKVRPDGTIQYAENPPKKYQDIYPFDFESEDWRGLWQELKHVMEYWCQQGVRVFRVDNPHTKALEFWEWAIADIKRQFPETIFLSEAFTRPKVMHRLAKLGFSQSYTYFTWRNSKAEFIEYFSELYDPARQNYFRPNLWPNTPDILPEHLQTGGLPAFQARLVLAATAGANYGIYGPDFELMEHDPLQPGSEEYLNSEKYEIRHWNLDSPQSLADLISRVNQTRREEVALQADRNLTFHATDNDALLCYSKRSDDGRSRVLVVVNLDYHAEQHGFVMLDGAALGIDTSRGFQLRDVLTGESFTWSEPRNYVQLDPASGQSAHLFVVTQ